MLTWRIAALVELYSAGPVVSYVNNPIVTFLPGTDPLVTCKIRSVSSAKFMEWSVVLFTSISSSPALPCPFDVSCACVFDLAYKRQSKRHGSLTANILK